MATTLSQLVGAVLDLLLACTYTISNGYSYFNWIAGQIWVFGQEHTKAEQNPTAI